MAINLDETRVAVERCLDGQSVEFTEARGELTAIIEPGSVVGALTVLRDDSALLMSTLVDICGVDYPGREPRFDVVYHLLSMPFAARLRLKLRVDEGQTVPSVTGVHPSADWYEREVFDMYGIEFEGHPDLRRILTDYGFQGHPLRKDFPLTGFVELRYDESRQRVAYEPVRLVQSYRDFEFLSPWEGAEVVRQAAAEEMADGAEAAEPAPEADSAPKVE